MLEEGQDPAATAQLIERLLGRNFLDFGYSVAIAPTGYRDPKFCLKDYDTKTGMLQVSS